MTDPQEPSSLDAIAAINARPDDVIVSLTMDKYSLLLQLQEATTRLVEAERRLVLLESGSPDQGRDGIPRSSDAAGS